MLLQDWRDQHGSLIAGLAARLSDRVKSTLFFEIIFMTYGYANEKILDQSHPVRPVLMDREIMRPKGRGKLCYKDPARREAQDFLLQQLEHHFPGCRIKYIC